MSPRTSKAPSVRESSHSSIHINKIDTHEKQSALAETDKALDSHSNSSGKEDERSFTGTGEPTQIATSFFLFHQGENVQQSLVERLLSKPRIKAKRYHTLELRTCEIYRKLLELNMKIDRLQFHCKEYWRFWCYILDYLWPITFEKFGKKLSGESPCCTLYNPRRWSVQYEWKKSPRRHSPRMQMRQTGKKF